MMKNTNGILDKLGDALGVVVVGLAMATGLILLAYVTGITESVSSRLVTAVHWFDMWANVGAWWFTVALTVGPVVVVVAGIVGGWLFVQSRMVAMGSERANTALTLAQARHAGTFIETVTANKAVYVNDWLGERVIPALSSGEEQEVLPVPLPDRVNLLDLLPDGASLSRLVLGVSATESGLENVTINLESFVHGAVGGSSGWGKSVLGRTIAYQLLTAPERCEIALIDIEGVTFPVFAKAPKLRYELCDTIAGAVAITNNLKSEMNNRKKLYKQYPTVEKLSEYNQVATEQLSPIICLTDEATTLFSLSPEFEKNTTELSLRARKYGIFLILLAQDFSHRTLNTTIRNQLSSRVQLKAQDSNQSRILIGEGLAKDIEQPGRGYCILPGRQLVEMQTPYLDKQTCLAVQGEQSILSLPTSKDTQPFSDLSPMEQGERVHNLEKSGLSWAKICKACGMTSGGPQNTKLRLLRDAYLAK